MQAVVICAWSGCDCPFGLRAASRDPVRPAQRRGPDDPLIGADRGLVDGAGGERDPLQRTPPLRTADGRRAPVAAHPGDDLDRLIIDTRLKAACPSGKPCGRGAEKSALGGVDFAKGRSSFVIAKVHIGVARLRTRGDFDDAVHDHREGDQGFGGGRHAG
jgi:hypothetical protein